MTRYAADRDLPLDELSFEFDGQILTGVETPHELEMEHENIIDVTCPIGMSSESTESSVEEQDDDNYDKDGSYDCDVILLK